MKFFPLLLAAAFSLHTAALAQEEPFAPITPAAPATSIAPAAPATPVAPATPPTPAASSAPLAPAFSTEPVPAAEVTPPDDLPVARAVPLMERDITSQLQIFLDQKLFGPGKIDGRPGEFTTKALIRYQRAHGLPETGVLDRNIPLDSIFPVYTDYEVTADDVKRIGRVPTAYSEQAKLKYLPYTSLLEFLTERFHCDPDFLVKLNKGENLNALQAGSVVRVPNVEPFRIEDLKETGSLPEQPEFKDRVIVVDMSEKMLDLMEGDKLLASLPITPGSVRVRPPVGTWRIVGIAVLPWFRWDEGVLKRGVRTENFHNIPAGPNNPVGVLWAGLSRPGIGIHGTNNPQTIGRAQSAGCIRTANWDAIRLSKMITKGMTVIVK